MKNKKLIICLSVLFILLSIGVKLDLIRTFDIFFYDLITFNINQISTLIYKGITFFGSSVFIIFICIIFLVISIVLKKQNYGFIFCIVAIISTIVNNIIKILIQRPRPSVLQLVSEDSFSFPSGHTMAAVSVCGIMLYFVLKSNLNKKLKLFLSFLLIILAILVGISRVYLGVHYMSDVLGGFIMSSILLLIEVYYIDKNDWL